MSGVAGPVTQQRASNDRPDTVGSDQDVDRDRLAAGESDCHAAVVHFDPDAAAAQVHDAEG